MSKKAFEKIEAGLKEAVIVAPYIAQIEQLTADLANETCRADGYKAALKDAEADLAAERERIAKLRSLAARARVFVNGEFLRRGAGDDENYEDDEQAIPLLNAIDDILKETGDGDD